MTESKTVCSYLGLGLIFIHNKWYNHNKNLLYSLIWSDKTVNDNEKMRDSMAIGFAYGITAYTLWVFSPR
ncbi:hypothetical protein Gferi_22810 [Geosporobacter ferrireducens]|uniref:Uncharacterized protein n=1 Tax=Geosporobacter ferrireducens TaxID=1424294 RepID=A0A1D8GMG6_9FIRM|nr:hypothetical protein Gferi_22810 [Geosporobacter ferrireducens]